MGMLPTRAQVLETLLRRWHPEEQREWVATEEALGRVLTEDVHAQLSIPVVRASAMDGVAVESRRFEQGLPDTSQWVLGEDFVRADTGDDFDDRFDAVIPIERVSFSPDGRITLDWEGPLKPGQNVRPMGSTIRRGDLLARRDRRLQSFDLACLALGGVSQVEVYRQPRVAFLPTGSELVPLGTPVARGKNIDSNSVLVRAMLTEMGAQPLCFPIVQDDRAALAAALEEALAQADIVIMNGGSSKGEEDFNARLLEERGVALFHWVAAAPGKPMCVALVDGKPVINLPGPPLAVLYGMDWCIRPLVSRLTHCPMPRRQTVQGTLTEAITAPSHMEILCMMDVQATDGGYAVKQKPWRGGNVADALGAGAFYVTKLGQGDRQPGETLEVTLLRGEED